MIPYYFKIFATYSLCSFSETMNPLDRLFFFLFFFNLEEGYNCTVKIFITPLFSCNMFHTYCKEKWYLNNTSHKFFVWNSTFMFRAKTDLLKIFCLNYLLKSMPVSNQCLLKVNNKNTRARCETY